MTRPDHTILDTTPHPHEAMLMRRSASVPAGLVPVDIPKGTRFLVPHPVPINFTIDQDQDLPGAESSSTPIPIPNKVIFTHINMPVVSIPGQPALALGHTYYLHKSKNRILCGVDRFCAYDPFSGLSMLSPCSIFLNMMDVLFDLKADHYKGRLARCFAFENTLEDIGYRPLADFGFIRKHLHTFS